MIKILFLLQFKGKHNIFLFNLTPLFPSYQQIFKYFVELNIWIKQSQEWIPSKYQKEQCSPQSYDI